MDGAVRDKCAPYIAAVGCAFIAHHPTLHGTGVRGYARSTYSIVSVLTTIASS